MEKIKSRTNIFMALLAVFIMLIGTVLPSILAVNVDHISGFDKGPSYKSVVPLKKTTMIGFDEESILDDYAYLAAVPTAIFDDGDRLFSHPLLFYQDEYPVKEDKEKSLNARQGLDYFMEDWMSYCDGKMDQMTLINVPKSKLDSSWRSRDYTLIESDNPYGIANEIALSEWSYSDDVVIAVIEEKYEKPNEFNEYKYSGNLSPHDTDHIHFDMPLPVIGTGGTYEAFDIIDESYKYVLAKIAWGGLDDYDLQLYDDKLGMVDAAAEAYSDHTSSTGIGEKREEYTGSFINNYGKWEVSISAVPKKGYSEFPGKMQTISESVFGSSSTKSTGIFSRFKTDMAEVDISLFPGTSAEIEESPFGCRNVDFKLKWEKSNVKLGFTLIGPEGTEIDTSISREEIIDGELSLDENMAKLHVERLGECREGEHYKVVIFAIEDISTSVDFTLEYSWYQNFSKLEGDCMESASNGAVLASALNAPLLYTSPNDMPDTTKDILYTLGVENIYLVNIGDYLTEKVKEEINNISGVKEYTKYAEVYDIIRETTGENDIIFTTIDPWTYWYVAELEPAGEYPGALFVGPAAYIAAHHGSPVIIVDNHPRLSQATTYHTQFWTEYAYDRGRKEVSSGSMVLSGRAVYDFLEEHEFGKVEKGDGQIREIIITVAGQYDIGTPWDRVFTGAALPGRFWGSPVDVAYAVCRNEFYPVLIFENPATQGEQNRIQGSESTVKKLFGRISEPRGINLVITKQSQDEKFEYPILETFNTYAYKFNEKAYAHWDFKYTRADGIVPYITDSLDPIDDGVTGKSGAYYPDISESEVIPFYGERAGYGNVFSTSFDAVIENLNDGVILWVEQCHGYHMDGGMISLWDSNNPYNNEKNPWRAYEPILLNAGNLREFVRWIIYEFSGHKQTALTDGLVKLHLLGEIGSTENPDVAHINTQLTTINKIVSKLKFIPIDLWGAFGVMVYRDRLKHPIKSILSGLPLVNWHDGDGKVTISPLSGHQTMIWKTGPEFDDALENLHSCGINTISCMPAVTYLHLTWMRHGTTYQIIDPWTTTDWAGIWNQMLIKRFAMGDTIGEAYEKGMRACGPQFLVNQWWWDTWENVELFGDPNLRVFVPSTEYSDANYWEKDDVKPIRYDKELSIDGHMPYGATYYPHEKEPESLISFWFMAIIIILAIVVVAITIIFKKTKKR